MLVLPLPVTPRSKRVAPGASWRLWRAVCWAWLRGIEVFWGFRRDFLTAFAGVLMASRAVRPAGGMRLAQAGRGDR